MSSRTWVGKMCDCGQPATHFFSGTTQPECDKCREALKHYQDWIGYGSAVNKIRRFLKNDDENIEFSVVELVQCLHLTNEQVYNALSNLHRQHEIVRIKGGLYAKKSLHSVSMYTKNYLR